jgi:hypothetical protein
MSAQTYAAKVKAGPARGATIGVVFAPTLGTFRGSASGPWGTGVCRHEHETTTAAERCARAMARRIREDLAA